MNFKTVFSAIPAAAPSATPVAGGEHARLGVWLVLGSAVVWSFGGALGRLFDTVDSWTVIFWRSVWAALFLFGFMLIRDGLHGTIRLFANMGLPGVAVSLCFATASTSFIVALGHTTVANILLIQAGVPLIAALIAWIVFRERVTLPTWSRTCAGEAGLCWRSAGAEPGVDGMLDNRRFSAHATRNPAHG